LCGSTHTRGSAETPRRSGIIGGTAMIMMEYYYFALELLQYSLFGGGVVGIIGIVLLIHATISKR